VRIVCDQPERIGPWVSEKTGGRWSPGRGTAIGLEKDGELVAGVLYDDFNGANVLMHVASDGSRPGSIASSCGSAFTTPSCNWA
jgi:hypothetical protein